MPRKNGATAVARMECLTPGCGRRVAVFQNVRGYLYTRCDSCGADQRNGPAHQVRVWQHAEPIEGAEIRRPPNVEESAGPIGAALTGAVPAPVPVGVVPEKPVREPVQEPVQEPVPRQVQEPEKPAEKPAQKPIGEPAKKGGGGLAAALLLLLGTGIVMVVKGGKPA